MLVVERGVVGSGGRVDVKEEVETKRKAELDALSREALGFGECQQTRGKRDDDRLTGCIETAGSSAGPASLDVNEGFVFPSPLSMQWQLAVMI